MRLSTLFAGVLLASSLDAGEFTLRSHDLAGQLTKTQEFSGFGCDGKNISPELHWSDTPKGTKSFAVTVYDPDAPTGSGWWHWVVFNIPASVTSLPSDFGNTAKKQPISAVQSITDFGKTGFGGACPPVGDRPHRYMFTVHALNVDHLDLDEKASPALVGYMLTMHTIAKSTLVSYYER
ncbi:MAG: YbhB/YbcL family Raf kinase inhibitor-like protein [Sulfuricurvum sp.]|jgi:Raf kinase inhibitor-like YbhB/YbcL family protein|nr:YbhB/YbcL family Raf kinase inhibitor-like protein [Sulfuricurvum sp.]